MTGFGYNVNGFGVGGAGSKPLVITFIGNTIGTAAPTATFSNHAIGTASADRYIVVCIQTGIPANSRFGSCTVGGESTTIVKHVSNTITANGHSEIAICITDEPYTSGTTADIFVNQSTSGQNANAWAVGVYALTGLSSTTATDTGGDITSTVGGEMSDDIDVSAGGGVIAAAGGGGYYGTGTDVTWGGLTERYYYQGYAGGNAGIYATGASLDDQSASTITVTSAQEDAYIPALAIASFL